ncbi:hypothetical protein ACFWUW_06575 [Streptomyces sp. NPDC058655]|uniref:hypothetical protein n=1 Tax=unclassified Streptomyces TaxID=2593676 RepID=UPI003654F7D0
MSGERGQGRGWVRIPASRGEQPAAAGPAGYDAPYDRAPYERPPYARPPYARPPYDRPPYERAPYDQTPYDPAPYDPAPYDRAAYDRAPYDRAPYAAPPPTVQPPIYTSLVTRWREAGRTLPGHPDEEWERLISQPCWPGR